MLSCWHTFDEPLLQRPGTLLVATAGHGWLLDENLGVPAYSVIWPQSDRADPFSGDSVCAYALDGDHYLQACVFVDRYGTVDDTRAAAVRLAWATLKRG